MATTRSVFIDIVDPGDVLVADAFDAVRAEAVLEQRRALQRLAGADLAAGERLLHVVAAGDRAGRAGRQDDAAIGSARGQRPLDDLLHGVPGDFVVPQVVAELFELIEDHQILAGAAQLPALVEDLLDVRFGAGRLDHFAGDFASHSKRSRLMPSGRMAIDWHANKAEL